MYILMGYYIDRYPITKKHRMAIYLAGIVGLLMHVLGTQVLSISRGEIVGTFKDYLNLPAVLYSASIFLAIKYTKWQAIPAKYLKSCEVIAGTTFGIYLVHEYVIKIVQRLVAFDSSLLLKVVVTIFVFFVSSLIAYIAKKLPIVKRLL